MTDLTLPTKEMSQWQCCKRLIQIEKIANRPTLSHMLDGWVDVETDDRLPAVAAALKLSLPALFWRIGVLINGRRTFVKDRS